MVESRMFSNPMTLGPLDKERCRCGHIRHVHRLMAPMDGSDLKPGATSCRECECADFYSAAAITIGVKEHREMHWHITGEPGEQRHANARRPVLACEWSAHFIESDRHAKPNPETGQRWMTIQYARDNPLGGNAVRMMECDFTADDMRRLSDFARQLAAWMEVNPK